MERQTCVCASLSSETLPGSSAWILAPVSGDEHIAGADTSVSLRDNTTAAATGIQQGHHTYRICSLVVDWASRGLSCLRPVWFLGLVSGHWPWRGHRLRCVDSHWCSPHPEDAKSAKGLSSGISIRRRQPASAGSRPTSADGETTLSRQEPARALAPAGRGPGASLLGSRQSVPIHMADDHPFRQSGVDSGILKWSPAGATSPAGPGSGRVERAGNSGGLFRLFRRCHCVPQHASPDSPAHSVEPMVGEKARRCPSSKPEADLTTSHSRLCAP